IEEAVRPVLQLVQDLEPVLLLLREEREQAELDRSLLQLRRPLGGDFRHPVALVTDDRYIGFRSPFVTDSFRRSALVLIPPENAASRHEKKGGRAALRTCASPLIADTGRDPWPRRRPPVLPRGSWRGSDSRRTAGRPETRWTGSGRTRSLRLRNRPRRSLATIRRNTRRTGRAT